MSRFDIVATVEHYTGDMIPLRNGWAKIRCPTGSHNDNTPSASVNADTGYLACFSCGFRGDAIDLIKLREGMDFVAAKQFYETFASTADDPVQQSAVDAGRRPPPGLFTGRKKADGSNDPALPSRGRRPPRRLG